jgi:hypothetical protein
VTKTVFLLRENRFVQRDEPMLSVRKQKLCLYVGLQVAFVAACVAISQTIAAIGEIPLLPTNFIQLFFGAPGLLCLNTRLSYLDLRHDSIPDTYRAKVVHPART